jgi:hypothetical protein
MARALQLALLTFATLGVPAHSAAQDRSPEEQALVMIADFADRICTVAPLEASRTRASVSGSVTLELTKLLKKLVGLGATAAGEYETGSSRGVLQEHLAAALADANKCKLQIWSDLNSKLLPRTEKGCRHPDNDVEYWGHTKRWSADSGWRRGGSSPLEYCGAVKVARERKFRTRQIVLVDSGERQKTERTPFKKDYYRYTCRFEERWQPIYKFADTPACRR